jgi:nucleotide-binding universal stress UspA family protein
MKQILVATDFSSCASNALQYGLELAKLLQAEVCAIHAIGSTEGVNNNIISAIYIEDYYNTKKNALDVWAANIAEQTGNTGVPVQTFCEVGSVYPVLSKYIESNDVAFLVMGTMGSTGISGLFGSNANTMVEKTKIPTLIIPLESKFSTRPVITLAADFETKLSHEDITGLNELIRASDSERLHVVNIVDGSSWSTNENGEALLRELVPNAVLDFNYIQEDNTTDGIMNFILSNQTDILCVVKHHHNLIYRLFNRSTVNQVMNRSIKAILVLHE